LDLELHTTIDSIAADWEALADRTGASPFDRPGWIAAWWSAFGSGELDMLAVRDGGELQAVLPLVRRAKGLYLPTNAHTPSFGPAGTPEAIAFAYDAAFELRRPYLRARFVASAAPIVESAADHGYSVADRVLQRSPYVPLEGYRLHARANKRLRRLTRHGAVDFQVHDGADGLNGTLRQALDLEGSGWKTSRGTAIVSEAATLRFYTDVATWAAARGMLRLIFLLVDGRAVAAEFVLVDGNRTYDVKGGYDPGYRTFSPGLVLQAMMIEWARDEGYAIHELLGDAEPWKLEWTHQVRPRYDVVAIGGGLGGRIACGALARALPLARSAGRTIARRRSRQARAGR
jgi:CelD/BcsL family acetyltransferase involved in cellulose biosynthesis